MSEVKHWPIHIIFDGPPSHVSGRFVEVENDNGASILAGKWHRRQDGLWDLTIHAPADHPPCAACDDDYRAWESIPDQLDVEQLRRKLEARDYQIRYLLERSDEREAKIARLIEQMTDEKRCPMCGGHSMTPSSLGGWACVQCGHTVSRSDVIGVEDDER